MKKLDRFVLKSFLGPLAAVFFIVLFILVLQFLWLYIDDLVGKGLGLGVILEFLGWGSCTILPMAMPLATLIASLMTMGNLGERYELLSMKSAGISLQRILAPLIVTSILISIGAFFISNNLIPVAYNNIYTLRYDIGKTKNEIKIPTGTFYNGIDGYIIRVGDRNKKNEMMYDVMVYNHTSNKGNVSLAVADSASIARTKDKSALIFKLYSGISYDEDNTINYKDTSFALQQVNFSEQEVVIPLENYAFSKTDSDRYSNEIMSRNLSQLTADNDSLTKLYDKVYDSQKKKVIYDINMEFASQLDTSRHKKYTKNAELDTIYKNKTLEQQLRAVESAISSTNSSISNMESFDRESMQYTYKLRRIRIESFRKFTLSLACLIFFFIGAPIGAIIRKGGFGTPIIISALIFVLYWVVDISGKKLARDGIVDPFTGAFLSSYILIPLAIYLTYHAIRETSLFDLDGFMLSIKKSFKKLGRINHERK